MNPLTELRFIASAEDFNTRIELLEHWIDKNIVTIEQHQYILNRSNLSTSDRDLIIENLAKNCVEELVSTGIVELSQEKTLYSVKLVALKNGKKQDS